ncbi:hypothetical protein PC129_g12775 [Phytophthora cactorum]|uniref:Uncharacterized protein n=1 Tax=Phytophthora cactorum TaxID=29920 RepID=A0A329RR04_9STRA|nr:hypothetical protein GQ600_26649 [Phytophthora cactorum]KAG2759547.1 hypothetical protein Pcac1_g28445 [Phytophthora cactorum]KAG2806881.1 hypothetical protein PC111_g17179 [Phytophthora cactorum]KAG2817073.1 hypothetical protein PC112_g13210 [Phytophthora cactorum]KAG2853159.1 hypothetical protein PC113_g14407 [Phytophthora cactorum]
MAEPLLLAARGLAQGSVASLPADFEVVASASSASHLAVLFRSRTARNCVRLGVFKTDVGGSAEDPELVDILTERSDFEASHTHEDNWTVVWSPDLKFLVISGRMSRAEEESEGVMWIFARPEWLAPTEDSEASDGPPLLLRVDPAKYLAAKHWNPATSIVNVFFPTQNGSKVFVLSEDGVWLSVSVQLAKLSLTAMGPAASGDVTGIFTMKVAKKLTEWHAGVTAACYDSKSFTLVVSGGVRDPSADLAEKQASSLSVWKVVGDKDNKDVGELLDFTMVLKGKKQLGEEDDEDETDLFSTVAEENGGLLTSVKSTLFAPLKMMVGGDATETRVMRGSIRHLALSPNGNFVSMVDDLGRVSIRQIDICADVLKWQTVEDVTANSQSIAMKMVVWLTSDLVALMLTDNSVIHSRFIAHPEEGTVSGLTSDSDNESLSSSGPSGRLVLTPARHYRPAMGAATSVRTHALETNGVSPSAKHNVAFTACELVISEGLWAANQIQNLEAEPFIEMLMDAQEFEDALATVALYKKRGNSINVDDIHHRIWMNYRKQAGRLNKDNEDPELQDVVLLSTRPRGVLQRGERDEFVQALDHLRAVSDKKWLLGECFHLIADDSSASMKKILDLAWDAWVSLGEDNEELSQDKMDLQRFLYRLETMRLVLCEEEGVSTTSVAGDQLFDGATYALFRTSSILSTAKQFAREGRVRALTVLLHRHGWNLLPHWLDILERLPPSVSPSTYATLLPAIPTQIEDDGEFCTLSRSDDVTVVEGDDNDLATPVTLLSENRLQDLTDEELSAFEAFLNMQREERNVAYGEWFSRRILELDTRFGQLAFAYELSKLAIKCLSGWSSPETKKPLEELFLHTERLYKCVYPLHLSACCLLPLSEWSALSMLDQAMIVVGTDEREIVGDVTSIIDRLDAVFVSQRRDRTYALDELFSWLAKTMSSKSSLGTVTLAAQLIQRSNPSISFSNRWIQSNARLIETALDVVYSSDASVIIGDKSSSVEEDVSMQRHLALVEQLWAIFQSLPVRKENDPPEIAQLQVAVDEMEDLMVTMDVLSRYGIVSSPSSLKYRMLASVDGGAGPHGLLEQMCGFALSGEYSDDEGKSDGSQWLELLQDAVKLKEHAFGERLSQEVILDVILKHLLAPDRAYIDAAQNLVSHWIASDVEAVDNVLDALFMTIRAALDSVTGYSEDASANKVHEAALGCIGIVKQLLSLPVWEDGDRAVAGAKQHYEKTLSLETDRAHACELLDLLTYGAVKMSPSQLRANREDEEDEKESARLEAVCQVFVSNPSNYKPSARAREWLAQHHVGEAEEGGTAADEPLAAVMYLAKLLRVDSQKLEIWMKGSYAALYCMDYDVAYDLTMQVIDGIPAEVDAVTASHNGSGDKFTLLHLVSLVLDLVSASSFGSWSKKRKLCSALFSAATVSSLDLFAHQVTDLVLSWLEKIEAIQALMVELGLSESDLEQRRLDGSKTTSSAEAVLLNELKVVVDLLHEEKNDRQFLLRLLQRGFQLTQVMLNIDTGADTQANSESVSSFLQQMIQLCVEEAVELTTSETGEWQQYLELGFSYLMLWSDLCIDDESFNAFCTDAVLSSVSPSSENEVVVRRLHHFFLLQAAQAKEDTPESDTEALLARRKRLESLSASYDTARRAVGSAGEAQNGALSDVAAAEELIKPQLLVSNQRYQIYVKLAQRCHEQLVSQKKSQELDQMSTFFNTELDLERFSLDESYRNEKIMVLATKKEHFHLSRQFASKYGIDKYDCVLAYIKHALLFPSDTSRMGRREQLDQAFAIEQVDILEEALQRPITFGDFLLKRETPGELSLYETIDGTDHVGVLLVLRMVLECSKRLYQEFTDSVPSSLFPLAKPSIDRITLLFMCLKKLKDIGDSLDNVESVDLKLIGAASTTTELLTPLTSSRTDTIANRKVAVEAVRPLLTSKTIKFVTKILRKLHRVTPSSMVMIYINDLLTGIWREHGSTGNSPGALSADLAVYAYASCVPCLSVLSNEHLMLFHCLFLDGSSGKSPPELVAHLNVEEEFYGQSVSGLQHFGSLLTPQKRVELVADTLTLFQTKYNSWQNSGSQSNVSSASSASSSASVSWDPTQFKRKEQELHYLERELAENICCLVLSEIEQSGLTFDAKSTSLQSVVSSLRAWFAMDSLQQAANEEVLYSTVLTEICQRVASVDLASLVMELTLRAGGSKASSEVTASVLAQNYQNAVVNLAQRCMNSGDDGAKQTVPWVERFVWTWVTGSSAPSSSEMAELGCYIEAICSPRNDSSCVVYERVVTMLSQSPSTLLKEIGLSRLAEIQTPADENEQSASVVVALRDAVLSQWEELIASREELHKWAEAAVLSHVLVTSATLDAATWHFGLHVKAVWSALLVKYNMGGKEDALRIFQVPSPEISIHFAAVFEELLAFIEVCSGDDNPKALRFAEIATVALSNLLVRHDDLRSESEGTAQRSVSVWQHEQQRAVQLRVQAQFQVGAAIDKETLPSDEEDATCWSALFARGVWGARLLSWYTTHAYGELSGEEEVTEAVILVHWEANNLDLAIQLLLMCPFDGLREKHLDRALSVVRQLPQGSRSWSTAMELALLRFDVAVLLQHGLHSSIVAFLLQDSNSQPTLWTSSGAYVVCAMVMQGEFAAAGRLTCALRRAHPLLWDVENARLLLTNYLRSLASSPVQIRNKSTNHMELAHLQHQVYVQTCHRFADALL